MRVSTFVFIPEPIDKSVSNDKVNTAGDDGCCSEIRASVVCSVASGGVYVDAVAFRPCVFRGG